MCYHCNNATKRFTMNRHKYGITQTAGLCLFCHHKRGMDYVAQGWRIAEDIILQK